MKGNHRGTELGRESGVATHSRRSHERNDREALLRDLLVASQELRDAETESEVADELVDYMENVFGFACTGALWFDDSEGTLQPTAVSESLRELLTGTPVVEPGDNPIWNAYRRGETVTVEAFPSKAHSPEWGEQLTNALVVPVGDYGVILAFNRGEALFDGRTVALSELLSVGGEFALDRLAREQRIGTFTDQLSEREARIGEFEEVLDAIEGLQRRIAESETRESLETAACEELAAIDRIACVWVGRPQASDTDLSPIAAAGCGRGYLDSVETSDDETLPAQQAASRRESVTIPSIAQKVQCHNWAKEAISRGFGSVTSVPLVYDGVLYGVLTVYAEQEAAFNEIFEDLLTDSASLLVNHAQVLDQRRFESSDEFVDLEFEISDPNCLLHTLAVQTDSTLRLDTVAETTDTAARVLVTVLAGDAERVHDEATELTDITEAAWFGKTDHQQLVLTVQKPFLASDVRKHSGRLVDLVADGTVAKVRIEIPAGVSERPVLETLTNHFDGIDLVSKQQTLSTDRREMQPPERLLTDRQFQILKAAYYGGYYETPREITGEELADNFDISSPVVYDHLQSSHRALLKSVFESQPESHER